MNPERAVELLRAYGADERRWPREHREALARFVESERVLQATLHHERELDALLDSFTPVTPDLSVRILAAITPSMLERLFLWLLPSTPQYWWRPVLASAVPLVLGIAVGWEAAVVPEQAFAIDWEQQEQALLQPLALPWNE